MKRSRSKFGLMKWIDHWVGLPLCFFFGLVSVLVRTIFGSRKRVISGQGTIAVFKFFGMGSIIEASPLLRAIRERYPEAQLVFVTFGGNEKLIGKLNFCDTVRVIRTKSPFVFIIDVFRQILWLRFRRVEAVIDLEFFSKFSTLLSFATRAPIRVGFHLNDFWRYSLITHPIYFNYFRHIADVYEHAGQELDVIITNKYLTPLPTDDESEQSALKFLGDHGFSSGMVLCGANINASELSHQRRWPVKYWAILLEKLLDSHEDMFLVLTGSHSERPYVMSLVDQIAERYKKRVIVAAGSTSFDEFLVLLKLFDVFITSDSGPLHMAAAQKTPTVSLWGPTRPDFYCPKSSNMRVVFADYHCSPCVCMFTTFAGMWCNDEAHCMQAIEPDKVLEEIESVLLEKRSESAT